MNIIYRDEYFFAIDKPAGYFVHPPERSVYPPPREKICLFVLREQFGCEVFPVHRLDAPTSGVLLFTFDKEATRKLSHLFAAREVKKNYQAVIRGYLPEEGVIDLPLESQQGNLEAVTHYRRLGQVEFPVAVGKKYPTARYSLLEVRPLTGRWHQIRRHFDRIAHPLIGDIDHGDSHHNRFFRDQLHLPGLCLRAMSLELTHPWSQRQVTLSAPICERWQLVQRLFPVG